MTVVRELITVWGFKVDARALETLGKQQKSLAKSFAALGAMGVAAAGSLFGIAKSAANAGDKAAKTSQALGVNIEALQEMQYAAGLAGVETESFNNSLKFLSRSMFNVSKGSKESIESFAKIGKNLPALIQGGASAETVMGELADRFKSMPDGAQKTALAIELFGRSGAQMIPMLNKGSQNMAELAAEARMLGLVIDKETAAASEEFNDNLRRMMKFVDGLKNIIGGPLIKALNPFIRAMFDFMVMNQQIIKDDLEEFFRTLAGTVSNVWSIFKRVFSVLRGITTAFGGLNRIIKVVTAGFVIFFSAKALFAIGAMTMAIAKLALGWKFAGNAALIAQAKMMLIPIAIGAAIAAIVLLIEDVYGFFQGKDSLTGRFFAAFPKMGEALGNIFGPIFEPIVVIIRELMSSTTSWGNIFSAIGAVIVNTLLTPLRLVGELLQQMVKIPYLGKLLGVLGAKEIGIGASALGSVGNLLIDKPERINQGGGTNIVNETKIDIQTSNLPPDQAAAAVQSGVSDGLERALRPTHQALMPGVQY
jgi:hypothetical protein